MSRVWSFARFVQSHPVQAMVRGYAPLASAVGFKQGYDGNPNWVYAQIGDRLDACSDGMRDTSRCVTTRYVDRPYAPKLFTDKVTLGLAGAAMSASTVVFAPVVVWLAVRELESYVAGSRA